MGDIDHRDAPTETKAKDETFMQECNSDGDENDVIFEQYAKDLRDANQILQERTKELDEQRARKTPVNTWDVVKDASIKKLMDEKEELEHQL